MKRHGIPISVFLAIVFALVPISRAQSRDECVSRDFDCNPKTACSNQQRGRVKHRMPSVIRQGTPVTVEEILDFPNPANIAQAATRLSQTTIDDREKKLFTLEADVWLAKRAPDDCDLHMEIASPGGTARARRIIAEIPSDEFFDKIRQKVLDKLDEMKTSKLVQAGGHLKESFRVTITGFGFFDGSHFTKKHPKVGNKHGSLSVRTLWEIHPVVKLDIP